MGADRGLLVAVHQEPTFQRKRNQIRGRGQDKGWDGIRLPTSLLTTGYPV